MNGLTTDYTAVQGDGEDEDESKGGGGAGATLPVEAGALNLGGATPEPLLGASSSAAVSDDPLCGLAFWLFNLGWLAGTVALLVLGKNGWVIAGGVVAFLRQLRFLWQLKQGTAVLRTRAIGLLDLLVLVGVVGGFAAPLRDGYYDYYYLLGSYNHDYNYDYHLSGGVAATFGVCALLGALAIPALRWHAHRQEALGAAPRTGPILNNMDATKQTLALKVTCLLSAILGLATPILTNNGSSSYLLKYCVNGKCVNYGDAGVPFTDKSKAALAMICLALVVSLAQTALHFTVNHALLGKLSIPNAFFFMVAFTIVASEDANGASYGAGFAFMIIGWLASMGHFSVSNKALPWLLPALSAALPVCLAATLLGSDADQCNAAFTPACSMQAGTYFLYAGLFASILQLPALRALALLPRVRRKALLLRLLDLLVLVGVVVGFATSLRSGSYYLLGSTLGSNRLSGGVAATFGVCALLFALAIPALRWHAHQQAALGAAPRTWLLPALSATLPVCLAATLLGSDAYGCSS